MSEDFFTGLLMKPAWVGYWARWEPEHLQCLTHENIKDDVIPPETSVCSNEDESKEHFYNSLGYTLKLISDLHSLPDSNYVFYWSDISLLGQPASPTSSLQGTDFSLDTTVIGEEVEDDDDYDNCESTCDSIETEPPATIDDFQLLHEDPEDDVEEQLLKEEIELRKLQLT